MPWGMIFAGKFQISSTKSQTNPNSKIQNKLKSVFGKLQKVRNLKSFKNKKRKLLLIEGKMQGLYFLLPALLMVFISFLIVRAAAVALMMTGIDEKRARFQALSAFSGT